MNKQKLLSRMLSSPCISRNDDGRLLFRITNASQKGGQAQSIGGWILRAMAAGEHDFIIDLPGTISPTALQIIHGAVIGTRASIEITGHGAYKYNEFIIDKAA